MFNYLLSIDVQITNFINSLLPHNRFFDIVFSFFSLQASSLPIWFVIVVFLIIFEQKINKKFIIYLIISLAITSVVVFGLKHTINRPRPSFAKASEDKPFHLTPNTYRLTYSCPKDASFPSGHTAIAFTCATTLAFFDKKRKWFYYLVAILISISRIYLNCHYLMDVLAGGVIGYIIVKFIQKKYLSQPYNQQ